MNVIEWLTAEACATASGFGSSTEPLLHLQRRTAGAVTGPLARPGAPKKSPVMKELPTRLRTRRRESSKMAENRPVLREAGTGGERGLALLGAALVRSNLRWVGRGLLRVLRLAWQGRTIQPEHATTAETPAPTGPFRTTRRAQAGDLLIWVPRRIDS